MRLSDLHNGNSIPEKTFFILRQTPVHATASDLSLFMMLTAMPHWTIQDAVLINYGDHSYGICQVAIMMIFFIYYLFTKNISSMSSGLVSIGFRDGYTLSDISIWELSTKNVSRIYIPINLKHGLIYFLF